MMFFTRVKYHYPESNTPIPPSLYQKGMVLIVVLWIIMLTSSFTVYLSSFALLHEKSLTDYFARMQQFEAAEAGLRIGEKQLVRLVADRERQRSNNKNSFFGLSSVRYAGHEVKIKAIKLPHPFCVIPEGRKGYYYQITAVAHCSQARSAASPVILESTIVLPGTAKCYGSLPKRRGGRSSWCQR